MFLQTSYNKPALKISFKDCVRNKIPVIGVTAVFGTTQEGAVDNLWEILKLRFDFINYIFRFFRFAFYKSLKIPLIAHNANLWTFWQRRWTLARNYS